MDINLRPDIKEEGIVANNKNGVWKVLCNVQKEDEEHIANKVCSLLGFSGQLRFETKLVSAFTTARSFIGTPSVAKEESLFKKHMHNHHEEGRGMFRRDIHETRMLSDFGKGHGGHGHGHAHGHDHKEGHGHKGHGPKPSHTHHKKEKIHHAKECTGLYVVCLPHASTNTSTLIHVKPHTHKPKPVVKPIVPHAKPGKVPNIVVETNKHKETTTFETHEHWPWVASIYINGELKCIGVLLDRNWVLADDHCINRAKYFLTDGSVKAWC